MQILIWQATTKDATAVAGLSAQLGYESNDQSIQNRLTEILLRDEHCVFVAVKGNDILGWIHAFQTFRVESDPFVEIGGLVVHKLSRKSGIGKMLVEYVIRWAASHNYPKIRVRCNVIRTESHRFYESIGFTENKEQKVFDRILNL